MRILLRALLWAAASGGLLAAGLLAVGAAIVAVSTKEPVGEVQRAALQSLYVALLEQALLPHAALALAGWLAAARVAPALDRSWRSIFGSLLAAAALAFPVVALWTFAIWSPAGARDVASTFLLLSGSVGAALLLARRALPGLGPGAFADGRNPS